MTVLGLDLSLTSTGLATVDRAWTLRPKKLVGYDRLRLIRDTVLRECWLAFDDPLVVVEGPSFGSVGKGQHERGGLWWMVTEAINRHGYPLAVVPPASLKKYATGKGNADKDQVLVATVKRFPDFDGGNDAADAMWLAAMGHDHLGQPIVDVPESHRTALAGVAWPS